MKTSSCKAKGRKLQNEVVDLLRSRYCDQTWTTDEGQDIYLIPEDIKPAIMGTSGCDVVLSPSAKRVIPFDIECKNQEKLQIWKAIEQTEKNNEDKNRIPLLIIGKNRTETWAVIPLEVLLKCLF